jgi:hypothetical protein
MVERVAKSRALFYQLILDKGELHPGQPTGVGIPYRRARTAAVDCSIHTTHRSPGTPARRVNGAQVVHVTM